MRVPLLAAATLMTVACALTGSSGEQPLKTVESVDLQRFMGDWYVIANVPTRIERGAHNAMESYAMKPDGTIATTFRFRKGAFDGPAKQYNPKGFVRDTQSNSVWGMRFVWPIKAEYLITYLSEDYSQTIIARNARDYVWVMARTPTISEADYEKLVGLVKDMGYDTTKIQKVPQRW